MKLHRRFCPLLIALLAGSLAATTALAEKPAASSPIRPDAPIKLFNGKDFTGLYTWMKDSQYEDPRNVFTVRNGLLRISGDGLGAVITKDAYRDYHLVVEFRFTGPTHGPRVEKTRDSGVLVHCNGADGNYSGTWMTSVEAQIIEGGTGDFIVVQGKNPDGTPMPVSITAEVAKDRDGETIWKKGGEKKTFSRGRINWFGRDPDWKDVVGFRGKNDVESPLGQWTRMDVVCDGDRIEVFVNGVKVNEAFDVSPTSGKILIQTEWAELDVRRWDLYPVGDAPKPAPAENAKTDAAK